MSIEKKIKITVDASAAKAQVDAFKAALAGVTSSTGKLSSAQQRQNSQQSSLNKNIINTNRQLNAMAGLLRKVAAAATVLTGIRLADNFNELQNKLRITLQEGEELADVQQRILDVSLKTRSSLQENANLYLRLSGSVDRAKVSQEELLRITETVNKAIQVGGSSAQEAQGAIRQFTQIVSSGFTTGFSQELNSITEQTPGLRDVLIDGLREVSQEFRDLEDSGMVGIKILKQFSEEGIGDLDLLLAAIASQADDVDSKFGNVDVTVAKAFGNIKSALEAYIGKIDDTTGLTTSFAQKIDNIARNFSEFTDKLEEFVIAGTATITTLVTLTVVTKAFAGALFLMNGGLKKAAASLLLVVKAGRVFTPIGAAITIASVAVGKLVADLIDVNDGMVIIGDRVTTFGGLFSAVFETIRSRLSTAQANFKIFLENIASGFSVILNKIIEFVERIRTKDGAFASFIAFFVIDVPNAVKAFVNKIIGGFVLIGKAAKSITANIKDSFDRIFESIIEKAKLNFEAAKALAKFDFSDFKEIQARIKQLGEESADGFNLGEALASDIASAFSEDYVGDILGVVAEFSTAVAEGTVENVRLVWQKLIQYGKDFVAEVESNIEPIITKAGAPIPLPNQGEDSSLTFWQQLIEWIKKAGDAIDGFLDKFNETFQAVGGAVVAFTDLFATLSSIRQDKLDEELRTSETMSDQERKTKEENAKKAFENSKKLTLAGIALQTGLAIMNALADPELPWFIRAANAAGAAATGAAQYARANAQQYKAPSPPSGANIPSTSNVNSGNTTTNVTINVTGGRASPDEVVNAVKQYIGAGGIIINQDDEQAGVIVNG